MSDGTRTSLGGWIVVLGMVGVVVSAAFLVHGDLDRRPGASFGIGLLLLGLGGVVMGSASETHCRRLLSRWGYLAGVSRGGWNPERRKKEGE
jgi:hypothetical protein